MADNISKIRKFIIDNFLFTDDDSALGNDDSFLEKGIVDSTGMLELIEFMGEEFKISIDDDELVPENLDSVNRAAAFVQRKTA